MEKAIQQLTDAVDSLFAYDIEAIDWNFRYATGKWSKKEVIGHLIDSAQINLQRFVRCTYQENFKLTYDQVEWVEAARYQDADINDLLILCRALNYQIIRVLKNYPPNRLTAQCDNSKTEVSLHTVEWLAQDYVDHMNHHLKQVYQ